MQAETMHRLAPKPCLQALDESHPCFALGVGALKQVDRSNMQWNEIPRFDSNRFDRLGELVCGETFAQQLHEALDFAARRSKPKIQNGWICVAVQKHQQEAPYACLVRGQQTFQLHEQSPRGEKHSLRMRNLSGQFEFRGET